MAKQGKYEITGQAGVEAIESPLVEDAPVEAVEAESPVAAPVPADQILFAVGVGGVSIEIAPANWRPPGKIADQTSFATGVWARIKGEPWWKTTASTDLKAMAIIRKSKSASEAMAKLIGS
jgi:hypothetical protein